MLDDANDPRDLIEVSLDQSVTKHDDGDFFALRISVSGSLDTSVPIDATASGRFGAKRRAEEVLMRNGIVPERAVLVVDEDLSDAFPLFDVRPAEPEGPYGPGF